MFKKLIVIVSLIGFCAPVCPMWQSAWDSTKKLVNKHPYVAYTVGVICVAGLVYACKSSTYEEKLKSAVAKKDSVVVCDPLTKQYPQTGIPRECVLFVDNLPTYDEQLRNALSDRGSTFTACGLLKAKYWDFATSRNIETQSIDDFVKWVIRYCDEINIVQDVCRCYPKQLQSCEHDLVEYPIEKNNLARFKAVLDRNFEFNNAYKGFIYNRATKYGGWRGYNTDIVKLVLDHEMYGDLDRMRGDARYCPDNDLRRLIQAHVEWQKNKINCKPNAEKRWNTQLLEIRNCQKWADVAYRFR